MMLDCEDEEVEFILLLDRHFDNNDVKEILLYGSISFTCYIDNFDISLINVYFVLFPYNLPVLLLLLLLKF